MSLCPMSWSDDPKPSFEETMAWRWEDGKYVVEGDSNIQLMNVKKYVHPDAFNIGQGGDIPLAPANLQTMPGSDISIGMANDTQFNKLIARNKVTPVEKGYIQGGGNLYTWYAWNPITRNLDFLDEGIRAVIDRYLGILDASDLVVASLPMVYPKLTIGDMSGDDYLPKNIRKKTASLTLNEVFRAGNLLIMKACADKGVQYLDIYSIINDVYKDKGKGTWWDGVHYALTCQKLVGGQIRAFWGV